MPAPNQYTPTIWDPADQHPGLRVTYQGPRLPFRVPEIPAVVAVSVMCLTVVVMTVVAVAAVLS